MVHFSLGPICGHHLQMLLVVFHRLRADSLVCHLSQCGGKKHLSCLFLCFVGPPVTVKSLAAHCLDTPLPSGIWSCRCHCWIRPTSCSQFSILDASWIQVRRVWGYPGWALSQPCGCSAPCSKAAPSLPWASLAPVVRSHEILSPTLNLAEGFVALLEPFCFERILKLLLQHLYKLLHILHFGASAMV